MVEVAGKHMDADLSGLFRHGDSITQTTPFTVIQQSYKAMRTSIWKAPEASCRLGGFLLAHIADLRFDGMNK